MELHCWLALSFKYLPLAPCIAYRAPVFMPLLVSFLATHYPAALHIMQLHHVQELSNCVHIMSVGATWLLCRQSSWAQLQASPLLRLAWVTCALKVCCASCTALSPLVQCVHHLLAAKLFVTQHLPQSHIDLFPPCSWGTPAAARCACACASVGCWACWQACLLPYIVEGSLLLPFLACSQAGRPEPRLKFAWSYSSGTYGVKHASGMLHD